MRDVLQRGSRTGSEAAGSLVAMRNVFQKYDLAKAALIISKVTIDHVSDVRSGLTSKGEYHAFDHNAQTKHHLDLDQLKSYGLGKALGCPAGLLPSQECKAYLQKKGVTREGSMLEDFAKQVGERFHRDVEIWFGKLNGVDQEKFIDPELLKLLRGEVPWAKPEGSARLEGAAPHPHSEKLG